MSMRKMLTSVLWGMLIFLFSCDTDEFNLDKLSDEVDWTPELYAPVAYGNYTVDDFVDLIDDPDSLFETDENNLLHIIYKRDSILHYQASELVDFPETENVPAIDLITDDLTIGDVSFFANISLNELSSNVAEIAALVPFNGTTAPFPAIGRTSAGTYPFVNLNEFEKATFKSATLEISLLNNFPVAVSAEYDVVDIASGEILASVVFNDVQPGTSQSQSTSLAGVSLTNQSQVVFRSFETPGSVLPVPIDFSSSLSLNCTVTDAVISSGSVKMMAQELAPVEDEYAFTLTDEGGSEIKIFQNNFSTISLTVSVTSDVLVPAVVEVKLPSATINGQPVVLELALDGVSNGVEKTFNLDGLSLDMTKGKESTYNVLPFQVAATLGETTDYVAIESGDAISVELSLSNMVPSFLSGDFGRQEVTIDSDSFELDIDLWNRLDNNFTLLEPQMNLYITNSIGIPTLIDADFTAYNTSGTSVDLETETLVFPYPLRPDDGVVEEIISYDKDNSNIVDFVALPPSGGVDYSGTLLLNPSGEVNPELPNFITDDASIVIGLEADLPLEFKTESIGIIDTVAFDSFDTELIDSAMVLISVNNGIPLDIHLEMTLVDTITGMSLGEPLTSGIIEAAATDSKGRVLNATRSTTNVFVGPEAIGDLETANAMRINAALASPREGARPGRIYSDAKFEVIFGVSASVDLNE